MAALSLLLPTASGSLVEDLTGTLLEGTPIHQVHYQSDAGTEFDAPDACAGALSSSLAFDLPVGGQVDGLLVPADDEADHYRVAIGQELVGDRVALAVLGRDLTLPFAIDVAMPDCGSSVTAAENQPVPPPSHPEPAEGERQVSPHNLGDPAPCGSRWFFVLNQFGGRAPPATIHAVWTDGSEQDVPLLKDTPATIAQYAASDHLGFTLHSVTANVPADWRGQFNLAEAPCGAVDGEAVFGEPATVSDDGATISFTPIEAGTYVLSVRAAPPETPAIPAGPPTAVPMSCHTVCGEFVDVAMDDGGYTAFA